MTHHEHNGTQSHTVADYTEFRALCARLHLPLDGWERRGDVLVNNAWDRRTMRIVRHIVALSDGGNA